jgi:aspartate aminotransferase
MGRVKASPVIAIADWAKELKAVRRDVIALAQGESDMDTPQNICKAAIRAILEGQTRYTPVDGTSALEKAIVAKFACDHGLNVKPVGVIVCTVGKQVLFNPLVGTIGPGDEVLVPAPCWVSSPDMAKIADGTPITVACGKSRSSS